MDEHEAKCVEIIELAGGWAGFRYRCCNDPSTDSYITILHPHQYTDEELDAKRATHQAGVEMRHQTMNDALEHIRQNHLDQDHSVIDLAGNEHTVTVDTLTKLTDEIIHYQASCCDSSDPHGFLIERVHSKPLTEVSDLIRQHLQTVAHAHANRDAMVAIRQRLAQEETE